MNSRFIYNPFVFIAGMKSFLIGLLGLILTSYLAYITGTHFYGFLNIDFAKDSEFWLFLMENCSHWIILSVFFFTSGLLISKSKIRAIDIFGTVLFSRFPLLIVPFIRILPVFQSFAFHFATMYIIISIYIISMIWSIILLFNAFKVSCNLKNNKLIVSFIICIVLSEILTKTILYIII